MTRQLVGYHSPLNKVNSLVFSKKTKTITVPHFSYEYLETTNVVI